MTNPTNMSKLSKIDELSIRKLYVEKMLREVKKQTESQVLMLLAQSLHSDLEQKATGQIIFMERWIKDIEQEIDSL